MLHIFLFDCGRSGGWRQARESPTEIDGGGGFAKRQREGITRGRGGGGLQRRHGESG